MNSTIRISSFELRHFLLAVSKSGKNTVSNPINGKYAHPWNTAMIPVWSAIFPSTAAPIPAVPNASPKNNPATSPTFPGINSCA